MEINENTLFAANDLSPMNPTHPGEILSRELKARGVKQKDFASRIGIQATHLSAIIHGTRNITPAVASRLEKGLDGISAEFWLRGQERYNLAYHRKIVGGGLPSLVSGYHSVLPATTAASLAQPSPDDDNHLTAVVTLSLTDSLLFQKLADRLGWKYTLELK